MADVFLSYRRDERASVETIASRLRSLGLTVWFDASMSAGETFNAEIDREARAAKAILVCWSPAARQSAWVNAEAMIGFNQKKLAACQVAGSEDFDPPTPFNAVQTEDLREWLRSPDQEHPCWQGVLRGLGKLCGRQDIESWGALTNWSTSEELRNWIANYHASPLFPLVDRALQVRLREEAERAVAEKQARLRRLEEEAERQRQAKLQAEVEAERERRRNGPTAVFWGSILCIPLFFSAYAIVACLAFVALMTFQWLGESARGDGLTYGAELISALGSAYAGVFAGRTAIDATIKAWTGWPTFVALLVSWIIVIIVVLTTIPIGGNLWLIVLLVGHAIVGTLSGFHLIARKKQASP
ncbi:MAG: hypothetical protein A4S17_10815 [Proteobacteria bacterium HN_bin10]|nr:MAG: hypothetical protein A4S17_10815 [Proteobacteria bacterium HN_bin10]